MHDRARDGMLGSLLHGRGQRDNRVLRHAVQGDDVDDRRRSAGQRAGLVESHAPHASRPLEMRAPFDEHAFARRARKRRDNRNRRGDHQRTGTRDDQQHEGAVDPGFPGATPNSGGTTASVTASAMTAGVYTRAKRSTNVWDGRALRLSLFDQMNDAGQRRIAPVPRDAHVEGAAPVDRAGKHLVAGPLVDRQRLAGDGRLIDAARRRPAPRRRAAAFRPVSRR